MNAPSFNKSDGAGRLVPPLHMSHSGPGSCSNQARKAGLASLGAFAPAGALQIEQGPKGAAGSACSFATGSGRLVGASSSRLAPRCASVIFSRCAMSRARVASSQDQANLVGDVDFGLRLPLPSEYPSGSKADVAQLRRAGDVQRFPAERGSGGWVGVA